MDKKIYQASTKLKNKAGETIVEAVISFIILLIILLAVATMIRGATSLNRHGKDVSEELEKAIQTVQEDKGTVMSENGEMVITLSDFGYSETQIQCPIVVKSADPFVYFAPKTGGETP